MVNIVRFPFLDYKSQVAFKIGSGNYDNVTLNNYLGGTMHANATQYKGLNTDQQMTYFYISSRVI